VSTRSFDDAEAALRWLAPAPALAEPSPVLASLRALLQANLIDIDLRAAAKQLGLSARSLQRELRRSSTTFREELARSRVEVAAHRLSESEISLARLALDVGYASQQALARQFRESTGESPSTWRKQQRIRRDLVRS
jgi:AraC-like DNA-binding protein